MKTPIDIHIRILTCSYHPIAEWKHSTLKAPYWRLYWNESRGAFLKQNNQTTAMRPSHLFLIPPETRVGSFLKQPTRHFYIHFTTKLQIEASVNKFYRFAMEPSWKASISEIEKSLKRKKREIQEIAVKSNALVSGAMSKIPMHHFQRAYHDERISKVISFIEDQSAQRISNDTLASMIGMNTNAFIRLFKETTGQPPQAFINGKRLKNAALLLAYSDKSINEIAEETGFCDRYYFTHVFRKHHGAGPAAYRKELSNP